jgi:hypothetical protein
MRSSSVKTLVAAFSLVVTVAVIVPAAEARPARTRENVATMRDKDSSGIGPAVRRFLARLTGAITTNNYPTVPIPAPTSNQ